MTLEHAAGAQTAPPNEAAPAATPIVAIAASAGGLNAITVVLSELSPDVLAPIIVLQHVAPTRTSVLAEILAKRTRLRVVPANDGDPLEPGRVYVAGPDNHVTIAPSGRIRLLHSEPVHWVRPAADVLFQSVAERFGPRAVAVILSGTGTDGAEGAILVHDRGGCVIAQDERTSEFFGMPGAAIELGGVDLIVPLDEIAATIERVLVGR